MAMYPPLTKAACWLKSKFRARPLVVHRGKVLLPSETINPPRMRGDSTAYKSAFGHTSVTPRDLISTKIRNFLTQAEKDGYEWAWSDTCCIDKTSSTELTEAINSMFRYYALSDVCYVYLADVPAEAPKHASPFTSSRWHTRGWTLQELLAPQNVLFMSRDWTPLGNKCTLAEMLERVTSIPTSVLRLEEDFATMSIATRMSWAARRTTTRVEDEAYCLLGIFGVNMPTIYGEGRNAFYRLQEEIVRSSVDTTLLVWGFDFGFWANIKDIATLESMANTQGTEFEHPPTRHAFASSPQKFRNSRYIEAGYRSTRELVSLFLLS